MRYRLVLVTLVLLAVACDGATATPPWLTQSTRGMVASDSPEASRVGAEILAAGGNAFDAAVATSLALAVARPQSTGLGGGGFLLAYVAERQDFVVLDFREVAPAAATAAEYARLHAARGDGPSPTVYGGTAVAVPGQLAGLGEIHHRFARQSPSALIAPALRLARTGFLVDAHYRDACREIIADFEKWPQLKMQHARLWETLLCSGQPPEVGDKITRPDLVRALEEIRDHGPESLYAGEMAAAVARAVQAAGGRLTTDDLAAYQVRERAPLRFPFGTYEIVTMPPPSSGGVCLAAALNIIACSRLRAELDERRDGPHILVEALKHAFADRARWLGDADFVAVPVQRLISMTAAVPLCDGIMPGRAMPITEYGHTAPPNDDAGTSHFCVVDAAGNVVSMTETINGTFGSLVVVEPYGIILNNQMDDFTAHPGQPNLYGLIQGEANAVAPGKRPLSSMTPTIVLKSNRPVLALGASGGPRIISSVLQVLLNMLEQQMPLADALAAVRVHHQWLPNELYFDQEPPPALLTGLQRAGNKISHVRKTGIVQAIQIQPDGTLLGASDPRKDGRPAGVP